MAGLSGERTRACWWNARASSYLQIVIAIIKFLQGKNLFFTITKLPLLSLKIHSITKSNNCSNYKILTEKFVSKKCFKHYVKYVKKVADPDQDPLGPYTVISRDRDPYQR